MLKLADTSLIFINPSPSNVKWKESKQFILFFLGFSKILKDSAYEITEVDKGIHKKCRFMSSKGSFFSNFSRRESVRFILFFLG